MRWEEFPGRVRGNCGWGQSQEGTEEDWSSAPDCVRKQREVGDSWA